MATCLGSSPLTRGTREKVHLLFLRTRFIPAYAGNSETSSLLAVVHNGSSPLTRGTPTETSEPQTGRRFIPAYAGNSRIVTLRMIRTPVHPRLRGELFKIPRYYDRLLGSSPLTRGTLHNHPWSRSRHRFIPAYAGNSASFRSTVLPLSVHPRLRGELGYELSTATIGARFIPAYAGNSRFRAQGSRLATVHPRLRGELRGT